MNRATIDAMTADARYVQWVSESDAHAGFVASWLINESRWFECEPLPYGVYVFTLKRGEGTMARLWDAVYGKAKSAIDPENHCRMERDR